MALLPLRAPLALSGLDQEGTVADGADPGPEHPVVTAVIRRPYARFRPHTPIRPLFRCRECGGPWPCQPARLALLVAYRDDRPGLRIFLATRLLTAIGDQPRLAPIDLAIRFLGWLPPLPAELAAVQGGTRLPHDQQDYRT